MEEENARGHVRKYSQSDLRLRYKLWFEEYKKLFRCVICKIHKPLTLEFHHLDQKTKKCNISYMISQCKRLQDIQAELKKCIAVCPSCHAEIERGLVSYTEILEKAEEEDNRPGENISELFIAWMLTPIGFTILSKYDADYIKNERIMLNAKLDYLQKHPDYIDYCEKRVKSNDPEVDDALYRSDDLGEFHRGFDDEDLGIVL